MTKLNNTLKDIIIDLKGKFWSWTQIEEAKSYYYRHLEVEGLPPKIIIKENNMSAAISITIKKTLLGS